MSKWFAVIAAINGLLAVGLGAFGAHGLKGKIPNHLFDVYQTAVQYHFYHVFALLFIAVLGFVHLNGRFAIISGWLFIVGTVLFSGSLYFLALGGPKILGPITPLGGLCFLSGWLCLIIHLVTHVSSQQ